MTTVLRSAKGLARRLLSALLFSPYPDAPPPEEARAALLVKACYDTTVPYVMGAARTVLPDATLHALCHRSQVGLMQQALGGREVIGTGGSPLDAWRTLRGLRKRGFDVVYVPVGEPGYGKIRLLGMLAAADLIVLYPDGERLRLRLGVRAATALALGCWRELRPAAEALGSGLKWAVLYVALGPLGTARATARALWIVARSRLRRRRNLQPPVSD